MPPQRALWPVLLLLLSCAPLHDTGRSGFPEPLREARSLGPAAAGQPWPTRPEPLRVIHHSPLREAEGLSAILVTFNQPMVRLGPDADASAAGAIRVEPPVVGLARWVAGDTLKLALTRPLQNARSYEVTVPAGLAALSGERLAIPLRWRFDTPRPRLARVELSPDRLDRFGRLLPGDRLRLFFNLDVDVEATRRHLVLRADGAALPLQAEWVKQDPRQLLVWPRGGFPPGARVVLEVPAGLRSTEGPLASDKSTEHRFETRRPLTVEVRCGGVLVSEGGLRCWPMHREGGLSLRFSEPVDREELLRALRLEPAASLGQFLKPWPDLCSGHGKGSCGRFYYLEQDLAPARHYRVSLDAGLTDRFGQRLGAALQARFTTRDFPPGLFLPGSGVREPWHDFRFKAVNLRQVEVRIRSQQGPALVRFLECRERADENEGAERCIAGPVGPPQKLFLKGRRNQILERKLALPRGLVVVTLASPEVVDSAGERVLFRRIVQRTELGLQARLTAFGVVAWVTSLRTGEPVAGARVAIYDRRGDLLAEARTDARGLAEVDRSRLGGALDGRALTPLLPRSGRYSRWWRREREVEPPELHVVASVGAGGTGRDEVHLLVSERGEGQQPSRAQELWERTWSVHDVEERPATDEERPQLEPVELARFERWEGERTQLAGYVSTERGIYRPGQRVHVHGALRRYRSWKGEAAVGARARLQLTGNENEVLLDLPVGLSAFGVFRLSLPLPAAGRLGHHRVSLLAGDQIIASHYFRVEEYREPPFEVKLASEPGKELREGVAIQAELRARYLFGGPVDGAAYRMSVTRSARSFSPPGLEDYMVGAWSWELGGVDTWLRREGTLDAAGEARVTLATAEKHFPWPCTQMIEAEVSSVDRQTVAARHYLTQHPGDLYVAHAAAPGQGETVRRRLLVVDRKGLPVGGRTVRASLHPGSREHYGVPDFRETLWSKSLTVAERGSTLDIPWPDRAQHHVYLVLSVTDGAGREARSLARLERPSAWLQSEERLDEGRRQRQAQLTIRLDRKEYLPGESATVTVLHRGPGREGMLFVERERVFGSLPLRFDSRGVAQVSVPVEDRFASSVDLRAIVSRSGGALRRSRHGPLLSATARLQVSEKPYRLAVALRTARRRYRPGERVRVGLAVSDGLQRPRRAEVVVMAVDDAVLQLTGYRLPDPLHRLLRTPPAGVIADDVRRHLAALGIVVAHRSHASEGGLGSLGSMSGTAAGRGGGAGYGSGSGSTGRREAGPRRRFLTTAWHASLVTDEAGRAEASFVLPDNLTRYRLMALAVDEARSSGTGQSEIEVDLPLVTLPAMPRLLRVGDEARAGVVVHNSSLPAGTVRVRAAVEGGAVELVGSDQREVRLAPGQQREVRFGLRGARVGQSKITLQVSMGEVRDTLEHRLAVRRAVLPEAASVSGETRAAVRQGLAPLEQVLPDHGGLEVLLSSTALTGVEDGMEQLIDYPYGCLEQKSSRLLPMLATVALGERFSLKLPGQPRELIRAGLADVMAMQRGDGGFGYWPGSPFSSPWATAYALIVLERAQRLEKQIGLDVPRQSLARATGYLRNFAWPCGAPGCSYDLGPWEFSYRSFILYALALHGEPVVEPALALFRRRHQEPLFARAMLLAALAVASRTQAAPSAAAREAVKALARELGDSLRVDGTWAHAEENLHDGYKVMMHSSDRSTAMVLLALLQAQPDHPMGPRLVRWFLLGRKQARFRNTQEAAWALLSLWDYAELREREVPDFEAGVWLGEERLVTATFRGRSVRPVLAQRSMEALQRAAQGAARDLVVGKRGTGTLYYVARLRYARRELPAEPRDHGFSVRRSVEVLDKAGQPLRQQRPPRLGDTLRVTLEVESNEARRYVVVEDPLPAGLEALDVTLATGARTFGGVDTWLQSSSWDHRELRDDRVLFFRDLMQPGKLTFRYLARVSFPGSFLAPPLRAEEMYTPELFGHGAAARVSYPEQ